MIVELGERSSEFPHLEVPKELPSRRKTREFVLQVLFAADTQGEPPDELFSIMEKHFEDDEDQVVRMDRVIKPFAEELLDIVTREKKEIDQIISQLSHNWKLHRMNRVDRSILRMAIAEATHFSETPLAVVLNEAIDLGKRYGAENSASFINGILDRLKPAEKGNRYTLQGKTILEALDVADTTG